MIFFLKSHVTIHSLIRYNFSHMTLIFLTHNTIPCLTLTIQQWRNKCKAVNQVTFLFIKWIISLNLRLYWFVLRTFLVSIFQDTKGSTDLVCLQHNCLHILCKLLHCFIPCNQMVPGQAVNTGVVCSVSGPVPASCFPFLFRLLWWDFSGGR